MDYLFFDIECADGTHMCSFGYVTVDENFNITEYRDILINPKCEFKLGKYRKQPYISLAYPEKNFYNSPDFSELHSELKRILCVKDRIVFGHAVASDLEFLDIACDRYGKKRFCLDVYDTQKIYAEFSESREMRSLEKIMEELELNTAELCAHKSSDDAEMSMLTVKEICKRKQIGIGELLKISQKKRVDRKAMDTAYKKREIRKFIDSAKGKHPESKLWEKMYINEIMNGFSSDKSHELIRLIYNSGYSVVLDPEKCDYYVGDINDRSDIEKTDIKYIGYDELSEMIGCTIKKDGEIIYSENSKAVNSLKTFFDNARTNDGNRNKKTK